MTLKWLSRGLAVLAGLSLTMMAPAEAKRFGEHPAMWKLSDRDTTIYLFGTFHLLPQGQAWRTPAFDKALAKAGELVLEVPNIDDPNAAAGAMMKLGMAADLPPLADRVPADKKAALAQMISEAGLPAAALDRFKA